MRPGRGGLIGAGWEVLQVTYANGDVERFPEAAEAQLADRNSQTLAIRDGNYERAVIATLALVNVRKWEWVPESESTR